MPAFCELINAQPNKRLSPAKFLCVCQQSGGFMNNDFIETLLFLEHIQVRKYNKLFSIQLNSKPV